MNSIGEQEAWRAAKLQAEVQRLTKALVSLGAMKVILFGSLARGRADLFTDIDLLVVMNSDEPFVERVARLYKGVAPEIATDLLVYTPEEFHRMKEQPSIQKATCWSFRTYKEFLTTDQKAESAGHAFSYLNSPQVALDCPELH